MFGYILHRMIVWELLKVFLLSLLAITGLLLLAGLVAEAQQHGLEPAQILAIMPLIIPSTLPYTLPATTLFATCVVYGRLAHDSEILAIKASGVNVLRIVSPAVLLGVTLSVTTAILYYWTIPYTQHLLKTTVVSNVEEFLYGMLKRKGKIEIPNFDYIMYVKSVDGRRLVDTTFMRKDKSGKLPFDVIAKADESELRVDMEKKQVIITMRRCYMQSGDGKDKAYVDEKDWPIDLPKEMWHVTDKNKPGLMSWQELHKYLGMVLRDQREVERKIALHREDMKRVNDENARLHMRNLHSQLDHYQYQYRATMTELHKRPALSLGCLCFVLVGCPVGIWFGRSDYLSAFITCFMPIVFVYYPLTLCGVNMSNTGKIAGLAGIWIADTVLGIAALLLFRNLVKH